MQQLDFSGKCDMILHYITCFLKNAPCAGRLQNGMVRTCEMSKETRNTLLLQGSILAAAGIFTKLIGFLYRIPMANLLGNQGNGVYSVAFGIYTVTLTLSSMSLPTAVSKVVSTRLARGEDRNAARVLAMALLFALAMGAFSFSLLYFGAEALETLYNTAGLARPLRILAPTSFLFAFLGVMRGYTQGTGTMVPTAVSQVVDQCFNATISIVAAWSLMNMYGTTAEAASWGAMGGTLGTLAGAVTSFVFLAVYMLRRLPEIRLRARQDPTEQREDGALIARALLFTILPIVFSQTIYQIGYTIDDVVFSRFMNATDLAPVAITSMQGVFNTQYNQMVNLPVSIGTAMAMTLMPSIVASHVKRDRREVHHKITSTVKFNMAIAIPCAVGLAVLAQPIMTLLFPALGEYHDLAANLLTAGSSAAVFYALSTITTSILQGTNHMMTPVLHSALSLVLHVALVLALLYAGFGVWALLIGNVVFPLVVCTLNCRAVSRRLRYRWNVASIFIIPLLCALVMGAVCWGVYALMLKLTQLVLPSFIAAFLIAVAVYGLLLLKSHCFSKRELRELPMGGKLLRLAIKLHL